jgi:hypothetical protein
MSVLTPVVFGTYLACQGTIASEFLGISAFSDQLCMVCVALNITWGRRAKASFTRSELPDTGTALYCDFKKCMQLISMKCTRKHYI